MKKKRYIYVKPYPPRGDSKKERDTMNKKLTLAAIAAAAVAASAAFTSTAMSWDGSDTEGKVVTGSEEETSGYWYDYNDNDAPNNGDSKIVFPSDVEENTYGNFYGPLCEAYGGIKATISIGTAYEYAFVGFGFNIVSENQEGADISAWSGIALGYTSTVGFAIELGVENEATVTEYNNYKATVAKSATATSTTVAWAKFKQESGWGVKVDQATVLASTAAIKLKFTASGDFLLTCIADANTGCGIDPGNAIKATAGSALKAQLNGRTLSFDKAVKAELVNLQGQVVASSNASTMDLSKVQAGVYMVRAEGLSQRIMVK